GAAAEPLFLPLRQIIRQFPQIVKKIGRACIPRALVKTVADAVEVAPKLLAHIVARTGGPRGLGGLRGRRRGARGGRRCRPLLAPRFTARAVRFTASAGRFTASVVRRPGSAARLADRLQLGLGL